MKEATYKVFGRQKCRLSRSLLYSRNMNDDVAPANDRRCFALCMAPRAIYHKDMADKPTGLPRNSYCRHRRVNNADAGRVGPIFVGAVNKSLEIAADMPMPVSLQRNFPDGTMKRCATKCRFQTDGNSPK